MRLRPIAICLMVQAALLGVVAPTGASAAFGLLPGSEGFSVTAREEDGSVDHQAGSHPFRLTTTINLDLGPGSPGEPGVPFSDGDLRELRLDLPPGLIENASVVPQCNPASFHTPRVSPFEVSASGESCPENTQIGVATVTSSRAGGPRTFGIFNLVPRRERPPSSVSTLTGRRSSSRPKCDRPTAPISSVSEPRTFPSR